MKEHQRTIIAYRPKIKMENTQMDYLIQRAINLIATGEPLPLDLFSELMEAGIDAAELERKYSR